MKKLNWILVELISALFTILWVYTGLNKFFDYGTFRSQIKRSPFLEPISGLVSILIPAGELLLAGLLVFARTRLLGLYLSFALMLLFTGYVWMMLNYAYDLPCSCGGIVSRLSWHDHLIFNAVFSLFTLAGILLQSKELITNKLTTN